MPSADRPRLDGQSDSRSVTSKVMAILEAFEDEPRSLSMSQIAAASGLPTSTAHRLIRELTEWGALSRDHNGRYQIGIRLWELSQNAGRQLRDTARPYLQDLYMLTQETAIIGMREGYTALTLDRVYGSGKLPKTSPVGSRLPLHATAVGLVLLAYEDDWFQQTYLQRTLESFTDRTLADAGQLARELERIKQRGYARTVESVRPGAGAVAVPVFNDDGHVVVALGLVLTAARAKAAADRHLPVLKGIAQKVQQAALYRRAPYRQLWPAFPSPRSQRKAEPGPAPDHPGLTHPDGQRAAAPVSVPAQENRE